MNFFRISLSLFFFLFISNSIYGKKSELRKITIGGNYLSYIYFPDSVTVDTAELGIVEDIDIGTTPHSVKILPLIDFSYETNLTVFTDKGIYAFLIKNGTPECLYNDALNSDIVKKISFRKKELSIKPKEEDNEDDEKSEIKKNCAKIIEKVGDRNIPIASDGTGGVWASIFSIIIKDNFLYFLVGVDNESQIKYEIENSYMSIIAKKRKTKRFVSIPNRLSPVMVYNEKIKTIKPNSMNTLFIYVFKKFTIAKDKLIRYELYERNGERNLDLSIKPKYIYKANSI